MCRRKEACTYYVKGTCTRSHCEYWHPPECQFCKTNRDVKQVMSVCSRITRLATIPQKEDKTTTKVQWQLSKLYLRWVVSRKPRSCRILKEAVETRCKKSWERFERYASPSLRYVKGVSGKRKDHRLEKYKSNLNISEVPKP